MRKQRLFPLGYIDGELNLLLGGKVGLLHVRGNLFLTLPLFQKLHGNLCGADTGQRSPGQLFAAQFHKHVVQMLL